MFLFFILILFILVYIKQNVKKKSSIIGFNLLVIGGYLGIILISAINSINEQDYNIILLYLLPLIISGIKQMALALSLIYFTNNMKNLKKILLIFLSYIILILASSFIFITIIFSYENLLENASIIFITFFENIIMFITPFISNSIIIFLAFKILPNKNGDILIDGKNDEERENTEK